MTMINSGDAGSPWGHPRSCKKTTLLSMKKALANSNSQILKMSSKDMLTELSVPQDFPIKKLWIATKTWKDEVLLKSRLLLLHWW